MVCNMRSFRILTIVATVAFAARSVAAPADGPAAASTADKPAPSARPAGPGVGAGMPAFDRIMGDALKARNIPGGALAIVKDGKLVLARGYGLANVKTREPVALETLFSTASVTKTITAAAVLRLVDQGKLSLDDPVYALLGKPRPLGNAKIDPQTEKITVRQLLLNAAGWNSKYHPDALLQTQKIARLTGERFPLPADTVTRFGLSRPLDFVPGSESHNSNFGYLLAAEVVQQAAHQPYETYVRQQVLRPLGISDMRLEPLAPAYAAREAHRYRAETRDPQAGAPALRELPGGRASIAAPAGNWLASVVDLARFARALSGARAPAERVGPRLLSADARQQMFAVPPRPLPKLNSGAHVGLGWDSVHKRSAGLEYRKSGATAGSRAFVEHLAPDVDWVLLLNSDGGPPASGYPGQTTALAQLVGNVRQAIGATTQWPARDLFESGPTVPVAENNGDGAVK